MESAITFTDGKEEPTVQTTQAPDPRAGDPKLLTPAEAADALRVSPDTLARWARSKVIASVVLPSKQRRYPRAAIDAILATGTAGGAR